MKHLKSERGQSLVELAISIVILLYLLAGAVEFGLAFFQFVQLRDAAQEGALYGSMNPDDLTGVATRARAASTSPIDLSDPSIVTVTPTIIGAACEGNGIKVEVAYNHKVFMPFISEIVGNNGNIPLVATVTDTILTPICGP
jgi:Flp pilus assembly protein TadG